MRRTKEQVYNNFASELAEIICDKATREEDSRFEYQVADIKNKMFNTYIKPHQKMLEKLPGGYLTKKDRFSVECRDVREDKQANDYYSRDRRIMCFDMKPDNYFMPEVLKLSAADLAMVTTIANQRNDLKKRKQALHNELRANIIAADSIDQIKEGWPEVADHVEELATQYGVKFQASLPRILGRHLKTVAATSAKKQLK
jgi:hypothetical protein